MRSPVRIWVAAPKRPQPFWDCGLFCIFYSRFKLGFAHSVSKIRFDYLAQSALSLLISGKREYLFTRVKKSGFFYLSQPFWDCGLFCIFYSRFKLGFARSVSKIRFAYPTRRSSSLLARRSMWASSPPGEYSGGSDRLLITFALPLITTRSVY